MWGAKDVSAGTIRRDGARCPDSSAPDGGGGGQWLLAEGHRPVLLAAGQEVGRSQITDQEETFPISSSLKSNRVGVRAVSRVSNRAPIVFQKLVFHETLL
jgi:hypothetical protein